MKFRIGNKSKKTIITVIALVALFAVAFAGGYAWVKSNDQSTAASNEEINNDSQNNSGNENNQVSLPNLGDNEDENTSEDNSREENSSNTTQNNTTNKNNTTSNNNATSSTETTATEDATTVIEQVVVGEKLVAKDTKMKWYPETVTVPETKLELSKSNLSVIKTAETATGENFVQAGDFVTYTIEVTNNGTEDLNKIEVSDKIPVGTTFESVEDETAILVKAMDEKTNEEVVTKIIWTIDVKAGTTVSVKFAVTVNSDAEGTITNIAIADGKESEEQKLAVIKSSKKAVINDDEEIEEAKINDNITYIISIKNTGDVEGTVLVKDEDLKNILENNAELVGAIRVSGDDKEYSPEDLIENGIKVLVKALDTTTVTFTVKVTSIEGSISNKALIGDNENPTDPTTTDTVNITIAKKNNDDDGVVRVGDTLQYTITLTNSGNVEGTTTVVDKLPKELEFISASVEPTKIEAVYEGKTTITWENVSVAGNNGTTTITVNTEVKSVSSEKIVNTVTAEGNEASDNGVDTVNIAIAKKNNDVDGVVRVGDALQYTITLTNIGNVTGTTTVEDTLPKELEFKSSNIKYTNKTVNADGTTTITWENVSVVGNNATTTITVNTEVKSVSSKRIVNTATAEGNTTKDDGVDTVNIAIAKQNNDDGVVRVGDTLQYTITLTNSGSITGTTTVVDTLPKELAFVSASVEPTKIEAVYEGTTTITWENVSVAGKNGTTTITVNTEVKSVSSKKIVNTATAEGNEASDNGVDTVNITIAKKNNDVDGVVRVGDELQYTITLTNSGSVAGTTTVVDTLPKELVFKSASVTPTSTKTNTDGTTTITWNDVSIVGNNGTTTITVNTEVKSVSSEKIVNTVTAEGNEASDNGVDTVNITIAKKNNDADGKVEVGDPLQYEITLTNSGSVAGTTTVVDTLPKELEYKTASVTPTSIVPNEDGTTTITWENVSVSTTEPTTITVNTEVKLVSSKRIVNTATAEGNSASDTGVEVIGIIAEKEVDKSHAEYGDILTYTITATSQSAKQQDLIIKDTIDTTKVEFVPGSITVNNIKQNDGLYNNGTITYNGTITGIGTKVVLKFQVKVISVEVSKDIKNKAIINEKIETNEVSTKITKELTVRFDAISEHPLDVILVLDTSGSMANNSRIDNLKAAAQGLVDVLFPVAQDTGSTVSVITFAANASSPVTYKGTQKTALTDRINQLNANGGTDEYDALNKTLGLLNGGTLKNNKKFVIFLSDGAATTGSNYNKNSVGSLINTNNASGYDDNTRSNIESVISQIKAISGVTVYSVGLGTKQLDTGDLAWVENCTTLDADLITVSQNTSTSENKVTFTITINNTSDKDVNVTLSATVRGANNIQVGDTSGSLQKDTITWNLSIPAGSSVNLTATANKENGMGGPGGGGRSEMLVDYYYSADGLCTNSAHSEVPFTGTIVKDKKVYHYMDTKAWGRYTLQKMASSTATFTEVEDSDDVESLKTTFETIIRNEVSGSTTVYADSLPIVIRYEEKHTILGEITVYIGDDAYSIDEVKGLVYTPGKGFVWTINEDNLDYLYKELSITYAY